VNLKVLSIETLMRVPQVQQFDVSPKGDKIAFTWDKEGKWDIYVKDRKTDKIRKVTHGPESALDGVWSQDGSKIAYISDKSGNENFDIFISPSEGGKPTGLTHDQYDNHQARWTPDGKWLIFISNRGGDNLNLYRLSLETGEIEKLTEGEEPVEIFSISPDSKYVAFVKGYMNRALWLMNLEEMVSRKIVVHPNAEVSLYENAWSPNCSNLLFTSNKNNYYDIGIYDLKTGKETWFEKSLYEKSFPVWSSDGSKIAYVENVEGNLLLKVKFLKKKENLQLGFRDGVCEFPVWSREGDKIFFLYSNAKKPADVWTVNMDAELEQLTNSLTEEIDESELVAPKFVRYKSLDGLEVPAWVYQPKTAVLKKQPPAVVIAHGGPEWEIMNQWLRDVAFAQYLVSNGYVVIFPNFRGSTGYGRKYLRLSDKDLGGGDLMDVVAAATYLKENGIADPNRIAIYGVSYGGYMSMMALTKYPDEWAAGVAIVGYFDWKTEFETEREYLKFYDIQKMGSPDENPDFFYERSPINFIDRIKAPVLFLHGANDPRCPVTETYQVLDIMKKYGKTFEYKIYPDEGHGFRKLENLIDAFKTTVDFLNKHLKS